MPSLPHSFDPTRIGVHARHCCTRSCKYGDDDCPVAGGKLLPDHPCESCTCAKMNPKAIAEAVEWWSELSPEQRAEIFLENRANEWELL